MLLCSPHSIAFFPNPASDEVHVSLRDVPGASELSITDPLGRTVLTQKLEQGLTALTLDISGSRFPGGVYGAQVDGF